MSGTLVIIGGHEDRTGEKVILREVARLVDKGALVLVTTASDAHPRELLQTYREAFTPLGVREVRHLPVSTRAEALSVDVTSVFEGATGIFLAGGDQLRLTSQIGATPVFQTMKTLFREGGVIAGTSAGASVISDTMIVSGDSQTSPKVGDAIKMAPGFGFVESVVIDQHFAERGRTGRLLSAVALNPKSIGVGIDEDTALILNECLVEVIGSGAVHFLDATQVTYSEAADVAEGPFSVFDVTLHVLTAGHTFDLNARRPNGIARGHEGQKE